MTDTQPEPDVPLDAPPALEVEEELRLGSTERGKAANSVVIALSRAARSFLLYDPSNAAIRQFLEALRSSTVTFLGSFGDLALDVRPWDLVTAGEIVYHDKDRERSIAFRLFRDGVRKITLDAQMPWDELLKFLEVLSVRYTGIRQTEDDMVVLLWKAGFQHIHIEAVEGFVADEENAEVGSGVRTEARKFGIEATAPSDFDLPIDRPNGLLAVRYEEVPEAAIRALLAEDDTQALARLCVKLVAELCRVVLDPTEDMHFDEIQPALGEVRDFLLAEGLLDAVNKLIVGLGRIHFHDPTDERGRVAYLASFANEHALGKLIAGASKTTQAAPPELITLLDTVEGNHPAVLLRLLGTARSEASRRVSRSLLERYAPTSRQLILDAIPTVDPLVAVELLQVLRAVDPGQAVAAAEVAVMSGTVEVELEALHCVGAGGAGEGAQRLLLALIGSSHLEVRVRALEEAARVPMKGVFGPLCERVKRLATLGFDPREAEALGVALYHSDSKRAMEQFQEWARPKGFFRQVLPGHPWLQFVAVSGLAWSPADDAEATIKYVAERAGFEVQKQCTDVMVKRRRRARGIKA